MRNLKTKKNSKRTTLKATKSMDMFANLYTKSLVNDIANPLATFPSSYKVQTHQRLGGTLIQQKKGTLSVSPLINTVRTYVFLMLRTYVMILCNWLIL